MPHPPPPTAESHFRAYEETLASIVARYPAPSEISFTGAGQSTVRINLKSALENYLAHPTITSLIPRDIAACVLREFVFSNSPNGKVYIGPRRPSRRHKPISLASEGETHTLADQSHHIPPIDCSSPTTLHAILHLKNFDHLPIPITIHNCDPTTIPNLTSDYPNIEILPSSSPGHYTIL